jgi:DNA-binding PadR family transcriptional regulator
MTRGFLGGFELLVLLAVIQLGDEAYGVPISEAIEDCSGRSVALSSVYVALGSLERKGLRITPDGRREAKLVHRTLISLSQPATKGATA